LPQAKQLLEAQQLTAQVSGPDLGKAPLKSQSPPPGTSVPQGTTVTVSFVVQPKSQKKVPNLVGLSLKDAASKAHEAGFFLKPVGAAPGPKVVKTQNPAADTPALTGTAVQVTLDGTAAKPGTPGKVPALAGKTFAQAQSLAASAGLKVQAAGP